MGASDDPPEATIEPHLEMSYSENMPGKIIFYCHQAPPPSAGGQTPVCDMRSVYRALKDRKKELGNIMDAGVRYYRTLPSIHTPEGRLYSWQKTFPGLGRQEVDSVLAHKGIHWEWTKHGALRYWSLVSAVRKHPVTGAMVWLDQTISPVTDP